MSCHPLFEKRILIVSGKGGVGRTTVAVVLARAAERQGKRVLLAQIDSPERLARLLGTPVPNGGRVVPISPLLWAVNMNARTALQEYTAMVLHNETVARALLDNRAVRAFLGAVPGLDAYAMLGKAWFHTTEKLQGKPRFDLVILDAPASGHVATMLKVPHAITTSMPRGPLATDAAAMETLFKDPAATAFVIVTRAEELPATEAADLARTVRDTLGIPLGPVIVNAVPPAFLSAPALRDALKVAGQGSSELAETARCVALWTERRQEAEAHLQRLAEDPGLPRWELAALPSADLGPVEVAILTSQLLLAAEVRSNPAAAPDPENS